VNRTPKPVELDEDFLTYLDCFAKTVCDKLEGEKSEEKLNYYRGVLFGINSIHRVYEDIIKGEYL
jgi:hypothetical protein